MSSKLEPFLKVVTDITAGNKKYQSSEYKLLGLYPIIDQGEALIAGYTDDNNIVIKNKAVVLFGDHTKNFKYVDFDFCLGADGVKVLSTCSDLLPKYLFYYLQTIKLPDVGYSRHYKFLKECFVPVPPLVIQKQIADTLDKADALSRKDQELLKKYDELAQSIFYHMFGDPVRNEKGWEVLKLRDVCNQITDGTHFSPPPVSSGIPYITAKHLKRHGVDFFSNPTYVDQVHHNEIYKRCKPEKGDILYIKDGATTGLAAINEYDFEFSMLSSLALIKPKKEKLNNIFLKYWLNNEAIKKHLLKEFMAGAAIQRFTLTKINQFKIILPPIDTQRSFEDQMKKIETIRLFQRDAEIMSSSLFKCLINNCFKD